MLGIAAAGPGHQHRGEIRTPPMMTSQRRLIGAPKALNCSQIWMASSRVGVSTTPNTPYLCAWHEHSANGGERQEVRSASKEDAHLPRSPSASSMAWEQQRVVECYGRTHGSLDSKCSMGSANAAVLPEPVCAHPITAPTTAQRTTTGLRRGGRSVARDEKRETSAAARRCSPSLPARI